jgi:tetratricopeptide (TPR) repeat protein
VFELHEAIQGLPGSTPARKLLVERALQYLNDLNASGGKDRELQLELAAAYIKIGDVQGHRRDAHLGDHAGAIRSFQQARWILVSLDATDRRSIELLRRADGALCDLYEVVGDTAAWHRLTPELIRVTQRRLEFDPDSSIQRAHLYAALGHSLSTQRMWKEAAPAWQRASDLLAGVPDHDEELLRLRVSVESSLAACFQELRQLDLAVLHLRRLREWQQARLSLRPGDSNLRMAVSFASADLGWVLHMRGDEAGAITAYEDALAEQERQARLDPSDYRARSEVAKLMITAAPAYEAAGRTARSLELLSDAARRLDKEWRAQPANGDLALHVGWGQLLRGDALARLGRWPEALEAYRTSRAALLKLKPDTAAIGLFDPRKMLTHDEEQLDPKRRQRPALMR